MTLHVPLCFSFRCMFVTPGRPPLVRNRWLRFPGGRAGTVSVGWTALVFVGGGQGTPWGGRTGIARRAGLSTDELKT